MTAPVEPLVPTAPGLPALSVGLCPDSHPFWDYREVGETSGLCLDADPCTGVNTLWHIIPCEAVPVAEVAVAPAPAPVTLPATGGGLGLAVVALACVIVGGVGRVVGRG
jgi:hypothetical protein